MNLFKKLFKIGQAETHALAEKMEDPVKMTEQGIRDLKSDLQDAISALAEVKGQGIKNERKYKEASDKAKKLEAKALAVLQKGKKDGKEKEAEKMATDLLNEQEKVAKQVQTYKSAHVSTKKQTDAMQLKVNQLRDRISEYENELITLKSRAKVAETTKKINKQLTSVDSSSTVAMLERMKNKVDEEESLADSYAELASEETSAEDSADSFLNKDEAAVSDKLAALKAKVK